MVAGVGLGWDSFHDSLWSAWPLQDFFTVLWHFQAAQTLFKHSLTRHQFLLRFFRGGTICHWKKKKKKILWWFFGDSLLLCCWIDLAFRVLLIRPMACLLVVCLSCSINITCDATNILVPLVESICKWLNYRLFNPFHIDSLMFNELLLSKFHCLDIAIFFLPRNAPDEYWLIWIQC